MTHEIAGNDPQTFQQIPQTFRTSPQIQTNRKRTSSYFPGLRITILGNKMTKLESGHVFHCSKRMGHQMAISRQIYVAISCPCFGLHLPVWKAELIERSSSNRLKLHAQSILDNELTRSFLAWCSLQETSRNFQNWENLHS